MMIYDPRSGNGTSNLYDFRETSPLTGTAPTDHDQLIVSALFICSQITVKIPPAKLFTGAK